MRIGRRRREPHRGADLLPRHPPLGQRRVQARQAHQRLGHPHGSALDAAATGRSAPPATPPCPSPHRPPNPAPRRTPPPTSPAPPASPPSAPSAAPPHRCAPPATGPRTGSRPQPDVRPRAAAARSPTVARAESFGPRPVVVVAPRRIIEAIHLLTSSSITPSRATRERVDTGSSLAEDRHPGPRRGSGTSIPTNTCSQTTCPRHLARIASLLVGASPVERGRWRLEG